MAKPMVKALIGNENIDEWNDPSSALHSRVVITIASVARKKGLKLDNPHSPLQVPAGLQKTALIWTAEKLRRYDA